MKLLVISDVHGRRDAVERVLAQHGDAATVIFLGDGLREVEDVADSHPQRSFLTVPGNCDFAALQPAARLEILGGKRFFITHGHKYNVKYGLYTLELAARERQADVVLFGHTHVPLEDYADGLYMLNPGSLGYEGSYGLVDVSAAGVVTRLMRL